MNKSLLSVSLSVALLSACGGSSSSSSATDPNNDSVTISVIDGYLENAEIYVDSNSDGVADADEKLSATTDADGNITISASDAEYDLIAQINGDQTLDSDGTGTTGRSYQMTAAAGLAYITPFTTIAQVQNKTLAEVAADLGIDESVIAGDYIAQKEVEATATDAEIAHAYARNLTTTLSDTLAENDADDVSRFVETIKDDIDAAINSGTDLDSLVSEVLTLADILVSGETFYSIAVNAEINASEDIAAFNYVSDDTYEFSSDKGTSSGTYSVDGNTVSYTSEDNGDVIEVATFVSKSNYIIISNSGILDVASRTFEAQNITQAMFTGTTWYQLFDDGVDDTTPCIMQVEFITENEMKYTETGNCEIPEAGGDNTEYAYSWGVENNTLSIFDDLDGQDGGEAEFIITSNSERLFVVEDAVKSRRSLFLKDKALAEKLFNAWFVANTPK